MVGCVVVYNDQIIGEGYHAAYGQPHAEVVAINAVADKSLLSKSTLYVNLEPCAHFGKTPPCANLIIENNIPNVVISNIDIHKKVAGKGVQILQEAGINVITGVLISEGLALNKRFFTFHQKKRPYIILKWAETQDGFIGRKPGNTKSKQISNALSNRFVHGLRAASGAILVGTNTAVHDNPSLTTRLVEGRNPLRVVLDSTGRIPTSHKLFTDGNKNLVIGKQRDLPNSEFIDVSGDGYWPLILQALFERNIIQVLVEGGTKVHNQLLDQNLWDEIFVIQSNENWNEGIPAPKLTEAACNQFKLGSDTITQYMNK